MPDSITCWSSDESELLQDRGSCCSHWPCCARKLCWKSLVKPERCMCEEKMLLWSCADVPSDRRCTAGSG